MKKDPGAVPSVDLRLLADEKNQIVSLVVIAGGKVRVTY